MPDPTLRFLDGWWSMIQLALTFSVIAIVIVALAMAFMIRWHGVLQSNYETMEDLLAKHEAAVNEQMLFLRQRADNATFHIGEIHKKMELDGALIASYIRELKMGIGELNPKVSDLTDRLIRIETAPQPIVEHKDDDKDPANSWQAQRAAAEMGRIPEPAGGL